MQKTIDRLRQRREELGDEGGFTLIELLIVIVILGILAAIVVFAVQNLTGQSAQAGCQSQYKTVETAMEAYKAQVGQYPAKDASGSYFTALTSTAKGLDGNTDGPWLKDLPPTGVVAGGVVTPANTTSQYYLTFNPQVTNGGVTTGTDSVQVGTVHANGAKTDSNSADGATNCTNA
jgi:type II secretion system protein G